MSTAVFAPRPGSERLTTAESHALIEFLMRMQHLTNETAFRVSRTSVGNAIPLWQMASDIKELIEDAVSSLSTAVRDALSKDA